VKKHLSGTFALVLTMLVRASVALAAPPCRVVDKTDPALRTPEWRSAVESLQHEVAASLDSACANVELALTTDSGGVRITARASDGRETSRLVGTPAGLSAVAFGLLTAAPGEAVAPVVGGPAVQPSPASPPPPEPVRLADAGLTFSLASGVRAEFPSRVLLQDFEVRADSLVHDWVVTVHVRAAPIVLAMPGIYDSDSFQEAGFGLGFGRQLRLGPASVLVVTGAADVTYVWIENDALDLSSERAQVRLAVVARAAHRVSRVARLFAALDGELSPTGLVSSSSPPGLLLYPTWSLGFRLGAEVLL
jgi:hypothetical protein